MNVEHQPGALHFMYSVRWASACQGNQMCAWADCYLLTLLAFVQSTAPPKKVEPAADGKQAAPQQPARPSAPRQPWWTGVMDRRFVGSFEPLAAWLKAQTSAGGVHLTQQCSRSCIVWGQDPVVTHSCAVWACRYSSSTRWRQPDSNRPCACSDDLQHLLHTQRAPWHPCLAGLMHR